MRDVYIVDAARTPRGRGKAGKGALSGIHPQELFAQLLKALEARVGFAPDQVDDVIAGCVSQLERTGEQTALITMCIGGGQGIATILERVLSERSGVMSEPRIL